MNYTRRAQRALAKMRANDPTYPRPKEVESVYTLDDVCSSVQGVIHHVKPKATNPWRVSKTAKKPGKVVRK